MTFSLKTMLWVFTLLASSLRLFGLWGVAVFLLVVWFWSREASTRNILTQLFFVFGAVFLLVWLLIPAVQFAREAANRNSALNNMKQVVLGMHNYHDVRKNFPPATTFDDDGNQLHSWRTLIVPCCTKNLEWYKVDFAQPWDSPKNQAQFTWPGLYQSPRYDSDPDATTHTNIVAVVGDETMWPTGESVEFLDCEDGSSVTIALIEVPTTDIHCMEPRDWTMDEAVAFLTGEPREEWQHTVDYFFFRRVYRRDVAIIGFADGHADPLGCVSREIATALLTRDGGEVISADDLPGSRLTGNDLLRVEFHWGNMIAALIFAASIVAPAFVRRKKIDRMTGSAG